MSRIEAISQVIMQDSQNKEFTEKGIAPLFAASPTARINIIGQAPGIKAQESRLYWKDKSGERLREWLGVDEDTFYNSGLFAVVPMDFYYPGKGKSGDLPPRKDFAAKWHQSILDTMPNIELTLLIGAYAQNYYLGNGRKETLTETVRHYRDYLPDFFPIVHPSPRNQIWQAKNPWFEAEVVPDLKARVAKILKKG